MKFANYNDPTHREFCKKFINNPYDFEESKHIRTLKNGLQQAIKSSSISDYTLGDLFVFGAFPTNYKTSVFHLHGRIDDPENMVITLKDYNNLYLKSSEKRKTFEEARQAVFTGSDILFIGMGMKENDIMMPLREFSNRYRESGFENGKIYALLYSSIGKEYKKDNNAKAQNFIDTMVFILYS
ncbi:MAG: SIR2 family protein [Thiolinea sp.]